MKAFITALVIYGGIFMTNAYAWQVSKPTTHTCTDNTHATCDGQCECDGMECN